MMMFQPHHGMIRNDNDYNCVTIVMLKVLLENVICGSPVIGFVDYKNCKEVLYMII